MVNSLHKLATAVLAAVAVLSCQKQEFEVPELVTYNLVFSSEQEMQGKTAWDGTGITWTTGDAISVTYTLDGSWASSFYGSDALVEDSEVAEFSVSASLPAKQKGKWIFHAIYPSSCVVYREFDSAPKVQVQIPSVQTPTSASFDPSADLMRSQSLETFNSVPTTPIPLLWKRLVAHADITLLLPSIDGSETIESVEFSAPDGVSLSGSYMLDLATREMTPVAASNKVAVSAERLSIENGSLRLWICMMPSHLPSFTVSIITDKATYSRTVTSCDLTFKANVRGVMSVDMISAKRTPKPDEAKNALVNARLFDVIDMDRTGLEDVKYYYEAGCLYEAAEALKAYYSSRNDVSVPIVDLSVTRCTDAQKNIADQALKENGYRFYIAKGYEESTSSGDVYYSFLDTDGGVNWDFSPTTESMFKQHLNRHPWVDTQALVYWVTKDESYVKSIVDVYMDWLETNPCPVEESGSYYMGMSHPSYRLWCNLQATARIDVYIKVIQYCKDSENFTPEFLSHLLVSLYDCVECIRANYYYADTGNIRLSETNAVINMAAMMPEYAKSSEWLSEGVADMNRFLNALLMEDGVLVEKDLSYHIGVVSTFYEIHSVLSENALESELPSDYFARLKNAVYFVRDIMYPDYSVEDFNDTRSSSWTKSVLKKNFVKYAKMFPEDPTLEWMATEHASGNAPTEKLTLYPASGYYMFRTGWDKSDMMLILKNNENAGEIKFEHCQSDNGTIALYNNGRHFLPDAGVFTYGGSAEDDAARAEFRSTKMHNTLTLNKANSVNTTAGNSGVFKASKSTEGYDMVHVTNQSYGALRHERAVFHHLKGGFFVVVDFAIGSATGSVELNWHLCPGDVAYKKHGDSYECRTAFGDGNDMSFRTFCFTGTTLTTDFTTHTGTSYHSDLPGRKYERSCYDISVNKSSGSTPVRFITVIYPFASSVPDISAEFNTASNLTVTIGKEEYVLTL